jgi:hypothetical protein
MRPQGQCSHAHAYAFMRSQSQSYVEQNVRIFAFIIFLVDIIVLESDANINNIIFLMSFALGRKNVLQLWTRGMILFDCQNFNVCTM